MKVNNKSTIISRENFGISEQIKRLIARENHGIEAINIQLKLKFSYTFLCKPQL